jgi:AcrR family transcriptional regulator
MQENKTDKRIVKTKRLIRGTFLELLSKKEFEKITVTEIAKKAEIDRKTFYLHYSNTNDLLEEFERELLERASEKLNQTEDFDINLMFKTFNEIFKENSIFFEQVIVKRINTFFLTKCNKIIVALLTQKIFRGGIKAFSPEDYHIRYIASGLITLYVDWVSNDKTLDIDGLSEIALEIVKVNFEQLYKLADHIDD